MISFLKKHYGKKYFHYYPNGEKRKFRSLPLAIENALVQKQFNIIEIRTPKKGSIYVTRSRGKTFIKSI